MRNLKQFFGILSVILPICWGILEENWCTIGIRRCTSWTPQTFYEDTCDNSEMSTTSNGTNYNITRTVANLMTSQPSYLNFWKRNKTELQELINEINRKFLQSKSKALRFHISRFDRSRTWISFGHEDSTRLGSFELTTTLCQLLGFTTCVFNNFGEYASESAPDEEMFLMLDNNHKMSIIVHDWTAQSVNITMNSLFILENGYHNIFKAINEQNFPTFRTFYTCDKKKIGIVLNKRDTKLILSEELSSLFGSIKLELDMPLQILEPLIFVKDLFSWDKTCESNMSILTGQSNSHTFNKPDTLPKLFTSINNRFKSLEVNVSMTRIQLQGRNRIELSFLASGLISTLILPYELAEVLGFTTLRFYSSGAYISDEDWDIYKFDRLENVSFEIKLEAVQSHGVRFIPGDVLKGESVFPAIIEAATKALYKYGRHKVHLSLTEAHLSVSLFDDLTTFGFSPCVHQLLNIDKQFIFQSKTTTMQLPYVVADGPDTNQTPKRFKKKDTTLEKQPGKDFNPNNEETPHSSDFPLLSSITPLSLGFEEDPTKCNYLINEVLPTRRYLSRRSTTQFIEIIYKCGSRSKILSRVKDEKMDGFMLIIVDIGNFKENNLIVPALIFQANLQGVMQNRRTRNDGFPEWYSVIGTADIQNVDLRLDSPQVRHIYKSAEGMANAIPYSNDNPTAVFLLYFKHNDRNLMKRFLLPEYRIGNAVDYTGVQIEEQLKAIIRPRIVDYFLYGSGCGDIHVAILKTLYGAFPDDCYDTIFSSGYAIPYYEQDIPFSFGRCSLGNKPYQVFSFKDTQSTPGTSNKCLANTFHLEFKLKSSRLQSTAQKIILNVWSGLRQSKTDPSILEGEPKQIAARLTGASITQISKAEERWRENSIVTPQKHKKTVCRKQIQIDSFDRGWIRDEIIKGYSQGAAKTIRQVFKDFIKYKEDQYETLLTLYRQHPDTISEPEKFACAYNTFRKVLNLMGFKYGVVNKRAGILQRDDIVTWRGKYLRMLRRNDAAEEPREVVYIDETWIDGNTRVARGWFPKKCEQFKDMAPFTYGTEKLGKGPRLVVLSAVLESGIIPSSVLVYKVSKSKTTVDYHDNVNAETFGKWYKDLLDYLDSTGKKYIIAMDNASYHSAKLIPNKSENKPALYQWLKDQALKDPSLNIELPEDIKDILKWELVEMVERVSQSDSMQSELYQIDKLTKARGHSVLRIPPYNCDLNPIELCWKDLKHEIRKRNTNQNLDTVKDIAIELLKNMDKNIIKNHFKHVKNLGKKYWDEDKFMDSLPTINTIVITQADDDTDTESDDDEEGEAYFEGDEVGLGGDMTLWDCDWAYDVFQNELDIGEHMAPVPVPRRNNRYRTCNIQQVHSVP